MLPNDKQLKSLMKKIKKTAEQKYEKRQTVKPKIEEPLDNSDAVNIFQEMKKLPFSE